MPILFILIVLFIIFMVILGAQQAKKRKQAILQWTTSHRLTFDPAKDRKIAYVFNLTKNWRPDWGGVLRFLHDDGVTGTGLIPTFNALNFFAVPQRHVVSQVATYAGAVRYSLTGWLMAKPDPAN